MSNIFNLFFKYRTFLIFFCMSKILNLFSNILNVLNFQDFLNFQVFLNFQDFLDFQDFLKL